MSERFQRAYIDATKRYSKVSAIMCGDADPKIRVGRIEQNCIGTLCTVDDCLRFAFYGAPTCDDHTYCRTCGCSQTECSAAGHYPGCTYPVSGVHDPNWRRP